MVCIEFLEKIPIAVFHAPFANEFRAKSEKADGDEIQPMIFFCWRKKEPISVTAERNFNGLW